ncbi:hypothetical protein [Actinopolyspora erythraea]|uniref:hypothetical protein n=1 Tax=Actinopolyspora erythraea TaxID=414996 RepID=UPI0011850CE5|nr:hypothetical protein [Actinopolyspora erythraea]
MWSPDDAAVPVRKLSDIEAEAAYTHELMGGRAQVTTHCAVRGLFPPERVEEAAVRWYRRFPQLSLRIVESAGDLWFFRGQESHRDLVRHSALPTPGSEEQVLREELNEVLPSTGRLWRLRAARDPGGGLTHLYLTHQRVVGDEYAAGRLLRALLDFLPGGEEARPPGREEFAPDADGLTYRPPHSARAPSRTHEPLRPIPRSPVSSPSRRAWRERGSGVVSLRLSQWENRNLRRWCAKTGVTVAQFLGTALARSCALSAGREEIALDTAVSLRQRYVENVLVCEIGCFQREVRTRLRRPAGGTLLDHAREHALALERADAAWRPQQRRHPHIRRAVAEAATWGSTAQLCVTHSAPVDTVLGPHAERVSRVRRAVRRPDAPTGGTLHLTSFRGGIEAAFTFGTPAELGAVHAGLRGLRAAVGSARG